MPMTTNSPLQQNGAGDRLALGLKLFSGEVLSAFNETNIIKPLVTVRSISNGKSTQFPVLGDFGDANVQEHTDPDTEITSNSIKSDERTIVVERPQYASVTVNNYEEAISHFDVRSHYSFKMGEALATKVDKRLLTELANAAQATGVADQPDGTIVVNTSIADGSTTADKGDAVVEAIYSAGVKMAENNVSGEKYFITNPLIYSYLVQSGKAVHRDFTNGNGGIDSGKVIEIAGVKILQTNHIPSTTAIEGLEGFLFTKDAVGMVELIGVKTEVNYLPKQLAHLMTAYYAMGADVLNPGACVAIASAAQA